jgi:hypothetical protein
MATHMLNDISLIISPIQIAASATLAANVHLRPPVEKR